MSQSPAPGPSSRPPIPTNSSSNFRVIFNKALKEYKKKTKQKLDAHPLAAQLDECDSPAAILAILQDQVDQFNQAQSSDERLHRWLNPTINVLLAFSETLGEGISLVFSPAKVIFVGVGVLLQTTRGLYHCPTNSGDDEHDDEDHGRGPGYSWDGHQRNEAESCE
ncbi:hypothetical protein EI94DRAFT_1786766 [Lactarius quietus]|nr:hypothetical protein EI94DRAFT_1789025 [Lactarius quietus]KAF8266746.1 hypothetical protein EI94DRAFT_1786766 [Lactarius quietus]